MAARAGQRYLVVALLSFLGMLANLEVSASATGLARWLELTLALGCGGVAVWAMHRLLNLLMWQEPQAEAAPDDDAAD